MTTCTLHHEANDLHLIIVQCDFCDATWDYPCQDTNAKRIAQADWIEHLRMHQEPTLTGLDLSTFQSKAPKSSARDQRHWRNGYQEALHDIAAAFQEGGLEEVAQWIFNNKTQDWG